MTIERSLGKGERVVIDTPIEVTKPNTEEAMRESIMDPCLFAEKWLGVKAWPLMGEIMEAVVKHRKVAVKACHASSKTFTAAVLTLWALASHQECIVITTAPTLNQVEKLLWAEVHALKAKSIYPFPEATTRQLKFDSKRYAFGFTTSVTGGDEGVKFQGFHSDYILVILDEAPGIDGKIWEALEGILASGNVHVLALGNPTISSGPFFDAFGRNSGQWESFTISAFNNPNFVGCKLSYRSVDKEGNPKTITFGDPDGKDLMDMDEKELEVAPTPYLCSRRWVRDRFLEWGPEDPRFQARCLGAFPSQSPGALISLAWLEGARGEYKPRPYDGLRAGLDVAGPGENETVLVISYGMHILSIIGWPTADPRGQVVSALRETERETGLKFENINVDTCGIGYYLARHIESEGFRVSDVNVGVAASDVLRYANLKAESYWGLRMMFSDGDITGLNDDMTFAQLVGIRYDTNARGQIVIESKEDMRDRGVPSPDRAEAIMLCFANSKMHGLIEFWAAQAKALKANNGAAAIGKKQAPTLGGAQKKAAEDNSPWIGAKMKTLQGKLGLNGLGKIVTVPQQQSVCPNCGNTGLSLYGDNQWACRPCGFSGQGKETVFNAEGVKQ